MILEWVSKAKYGFPLRIAGIAGKRTGKHKTLGIPRWVGIKTYQGTTSDCLFVSLGGPSHLWVRESPGILSPEYMYIIYIYICVCVCNCIYIYIIQLWFVISDNYMQILYWFLDVKPFCVSHARMRKATQNSLWSARSLPHCTFTDWPQFTKKTGKRVVFPFHSCLEIM